MGKKIEDMKSTTMKFITPIPDKKYYLWQQLVQIANFREMGYEQDLHIPVLYFKNKPSDLLIKLSTNKDLKCHWYLYPDSRTDKAYSASMKPYLMGLYFKDHPNECRNTYNYLDPDCIFTKPMDFSPFMLDDNTWYGSSTKSFTGEKYIKSKGVQLFYDLCNIAGVDPKLMEGKTGWEVGAQYFIKNSTSEMWFDIEKKSVEAYKYMKNTAKIYHPEGQKNPIQSWCSEMYLTQMIALRCGIKLQTTPLMNFHWAEHNIKKWLDKPYFHNAGQIKANDRDMCKLTYHNISPFRKDVKVSPESASYNYVQLIKRTEEMFPDLIWD